jgi:hypothetical protein
MRRGGCTSARTSTEEQMRENIAYAVRREDRRPEGEMFDLSREAKRLRSALAER